TTTASVPSAARARVACHAPPPIRGAAPATTSRERCPITASNGTGRKRKRQHQEKRGEEAGHRCGEGDVAGMSPVDELRPEHRPDRREPLIEAEADGPCDQPGGSPVRSTEDPLL